MKPLNEVICGFCDFGLFVENAIQASKKYKHVYYFNPAWRSPFPSSRDLTIGTGFENITVIQNFWDYKKYLDLVIVPDVYMYDIQNELRSQNIPVWGMGSVEWLENDRFKMNDWLMQNDLPIPKREEKFGVESLKDTPKGSHIKINQWREDAETFKKFGSPQIDGYFDQLNFYLGHRKKDYRFMVEENIDGIEFGIDSYTVDGKYPELSIYGAEIKGSCYLGKAARTNRLPQSLKLVDDKLSKLFREYEARGNFSTEVRIDKNRKGYLTDFTARLGNPPSSCQMEIIGNLPEIAWAGANGELIEPEIRARYCAQATMTSEFAAQSELAFEFPDSIRRFVKIKNVCKADGVYYYIPNKGSKITTVGAIVGLGSTKEEAVENCKKNASEVKAFQLEIDTYALDEAIEETQKANKDFGFNF